MRCRAMISLIGGLLILTISLGSARASLANAIPALASIEIRGSVSGLFNAQNMLFHYQFMGKQGDRIALTLQSPELPVDLAFIGWNTGLFVKTLHVRGKPERLPLTVPGDGAYLIIVTLAKAGMGKFSLTLNLDSDHPADAPSLDLSGQVPTVVNRLQQAGLIPDGGKQVVSVPNGFGTTSDPGYSVVTIERAQSIGNMLLSYQVGWLSAGATSGCGFMFHVADGGFSMALLRQDGQVALIQRQGDQNNVDYERSTDLFKPGSFTTVTLMAVGDKVSLYLNGKLETTQSVVPSKGSFAINVFNPPGNMAITDCRFRNIWVWSFDS